MLVRRAWTVTGLLALAACGGIAVIDAGGDTGGAGGRGGAASTTTVSSSVSSTSASSTSTASTGAGHTCDAGYVPCCQAACQAAIDVGCEFGPHSLDDCPCEVPAPGFGCEDASVAWFACLAQTPGAQACDDMSNLILVCEECAMERGIFEISCSSYTTCGGI